MRKLYVVATPAALSFKKVGEYSITGIHILKFFKNESEALRFEEAIYDKNGLTSEIYEVQQEEVHLLLLHTAGESLIVAFSDDLEGINGLLAQYQSELPGSKFETRMFTSTDFFDGGVYA